MSEQSTQYDKGKFKLHANIKWLFSFIPRHHVDEVKSNVVKNLASLQLPPYKADSVWSDIIALLVSCEMYRCVCLAIFGSPAPTNHWDVIQVLAKHGFYAIQSDGTGVVQTSLLTASPFKQDAHIAVIDCLMNAYACHLVTIPRVVAAVKRIGPFNASQELPYDLEDSLILWVNKICDKVVVKLRSAQRKVVEEQRMGKTHSVPTDTVPQFQRVEDLVQDIGDGQALGVLIHNYLPKDLPLEALKFGPTLMPSDRANNMAAVRFTLMTALGMDWFPMKLEMFMHPCFTIKANVLVFVSELFWKFELKGSSRTDFSTKRLLKEEEASPQEMLCAAAATEISTQLSKTPLILEQQRKAQRKLSESSNGDQEDTTTYPELSKEEAETQLQTLLDSHSPALIPPYPNPPPAPPLSPQLPLDVDEEQLDTFRYFHNAAPSHSTHTVTDDSQSLGQISISDLPGFRESRDTAALSRQESTGPTSHSLRQLHIATEGLAEQESSATFRASLVNEDVIRFVEQPQPPREETSTPIIIASSMIHSPSPIKKRLFSSVSLDKDSGRRSTEGLVTKSLSHLGGVRPRSSGVVKGEEAGEDLNVTYTPEKADKENEEVVLVKSPKASKRRVKSGEEKVEEMAGNECEKREFYNNIAKWVATVEKECKAEPLPDSKLLNNPALTKSLKMQFSRESTVVTPVYNSVDPIMPHPAEMTIPGLNQTTMPMVGKSYTISSTQRDEAKKKGLPIINNSITSLDVPVAPAAAPPDKIKEDYSMTIHERDEAIRLKKEAEEQAKKEELDRKRILEEELAEKKALDEMSDSSNKSSGSKKGKKPTKGKPAGNAKNSKQKEGKSFPRRPGSGGSDTSKKSNKSAKAGAKGAKRDKSKDDMSVKSEKMIRAKGGKEAPGGPKRRAKSARRAGKSVSFIDECGPLPEPLPPAMDLVPKEEPDPVCPHKRDTKVIGDDSAAVEKAKIAFFVPMERSGVGVGSGPVDRVTGAYPEWEERSCEDSLQVMPEITSLSSGSDSEADSEGGSQSESEEEAVRLSNGDVQNMLDTMRPQINDLEPVIQFEKRSSWQPSTPLPTDPKQRLIQLQIQEKRKNIEKQRDAIIAKWEEERSALNRHVFYEALKKTKDVGEQANPENIREEIERSDSLENVETITEDWNNTEPFLASQSGATPTHIRPPTLMEQAIAVTEEIFSTPNLEEEEDRADDVETDKLVGVFSNHEQLLEKKISTPPPPLSSTPSTMQYFYGFTDVITDTSVSEKKKKFIVGQMKKQEEMKARRELELQRKLENARQKSHMDAVLRRDDGNLITKFRAKSARIRVITPDDDLITAPSQPRAKSALPTKREIISCKTPEPGTMYPNQCKTPGVMYPNRDTSMKQIQNGSTTYRKHYSQPTSPQTSLPPKGPCTKRNSDTEKPGLTRKDSASLGRRIDARNESLGRKDSQSERPRLGRKDSESDKTKTKLVRKDSNSKPPSVPLFVKPSVKSNGKVVEKAVCWTCLSGVPDRQAQQDAVQSISENPSAQYVILFRDRIACKFRAIYTVDSQTEKLYKIFGVGPRTITKDKISKLYKYNSGARNFDELPTSNFSPTVDAIAVDNSVWKKAGVAPS